MSKREKMLVAASVAAFIWGSVMIVGTLDQPGVSSSPAEDVNAFVATVSAAVSDDPSHGLNDMILSRARGRWGDIPFDLSGPVNYDPNEDLHYQGYVRSGDLILALINNREYRLGEDMDGRGIQINAITPDRVVLVEQGRRKRILPLEGGL